MRSPRFFRATLFAALPRFLAVYGTLALAILTCRGVPPGGVTPASPWDSSGHFQTALGYNDNVLRRHRHPNPSPFLWNSLEWLGMKMPDRGREGFVSVNAERTQYFDARGVNSEQSVLLLGRGKIQGLSSWTASMDGSFAWQDQVLDVSTFEATLTTLKIAGHQYVVRPSLRRDLPGAAWIEGQAPTVRQRFPPPLDDYWEAGPALVLGKGYGYRSEATLTYDWACRLYDTRLPFTAAGQKMTQAGLLVTQRHRTFLTWRHYWDEPRVWRTQTRLEWSRLLDNGEGFFDFDKIQGSLQLRCRRAPWEWSLESRAAWHQYPVQRVSSTDLRHRQRLDVQAAGRCQRALTERVSLFTEGEWRLFTSNRSLDAYHAIHIIAGVDISF